MYRDDIDRALAIAERYGVAVRLTPGFPHLPFLFRDEIVPEDRRTRGLSKEDDMPDRPSVTSGPNLHYCDVKKRIVWFDHLDPDEVETHLHEICHVIMQHPDHGIDAFSEDMVLMPFERTLARQCLSWKGYRRVVKWQETTQVDWWDRTGTREYFALENVPHYTRWAYWRESFRALRRMGAIAGGRSARVTWRWPDWKRLPQALANRCRTP